MSRDIDINLIRTFLAVAESGGMTSAAHTLHLTQGAVSQKIRRLEELFGAELFERRNKTIRLTPQGERLMSRAHRMISLNDETWQLMTKPDFTGEIKLGVPLDIVRPMMPDIMRRFSREHPKIQLSLVCDMTENLLVALKNGEIDLTLTTETTAGGLEELLLRDKLVWIGANNGEACLKSPLPVSLGERLCAFRGPALEALNQMQIDWKTVCSVGNVDSYLATVGADMAVAPYMSSLVPKDLSIVSHEAGLPELPECYINIRVADGKGNRLVRELIKYIKQGFSSF